MLAKVRGFVRECLRFMGHSISWNDAIKDCSKREAGRDMRPASRLAMESSANARESLGKHRHLTARRRVQSPVHRKQRRHFLVAMERPLKTRELVLHLCDKRGEHAVRAPRGTSIVGTLLATSDFPRFFAPR